VKKKLFILAIITFLGLASVAQVSINSDGSSPVNSAMLDVKSTSKGFLPPRMTTIQRDSIVDPVPGLQIFNTTTNCLEFYINNGWLSIGCGCTAAPSGLPEAAGHVSAGSQITWNWKTVLGATGYKYNTVNNYETASDNHALTSYTQTGLTCTGTSQTLFVWAYNACGHSSAAVFSASLVYRLNVIKTGNGSGNVASSAVGIDCGSDCSSDLGCGTPVTLTATPNAGSYFSGWSGGGCFGTAPCVTTIDTAQNVTATFTLSSFTLTVTKDGNGTGTIISSPAGIFCNTSCSTDFDYGTVVTLTAIPDPGCTFAGWSGDGCCGNCVCITAMWNSRNVTATFTRDAFPLTVTRTGSGSGTVTSSPLAIFCGATCNADFEAGSVVTLHASPEAGSVFAGWSGGCAGTGSCAISMDSAKSVTASFTHESYPLTVTRVGPGTVTSSPSGIYCGAACNANYDSGTLVTLMATPDAGATFAGWSGAYTGTGSCTITMDMAKSVTATFTRESYPLTVTKIGPGTVTGTPTGIYCGAACNASYNAGTLVTLTATADAEATFTGWSGACTGTGGCAVNMDMAKNVTATFILDSYLLSLSKTGNGAGTVTSNPSGIACGLTCSASFNAGTTITLTATPTSGSTFTGWSGGGCSGTGPCVATIHSAQTISANFNLNAYTLAILKAGSGSGTVTSSPAGINCGTTCSANYLFGTTVTLTATPAVGSFFSGWSGGGCSGTGTCVTTVSNGQNVTATFTLQ